MVELAQRDIKVLKAMDQGDKDPKEIAERVEIPIESVISSAEFLAENELIEIHKSIDETYSLNAEGLKYAKEGLPERKILEKSILSPTSISELKEPSAKLGIGWLKRKGWASIDRGTIKPTGDAPYGDDEKALKHLLEGSKKVSEFNESTLSVLKSRELVTANMHKSWKYKLTEKGKNEIKTNPHFRKGTREKTDRSIASSFHAVIVDVVINQITAEHIKNGKWGGSGLADNYVSLDDKLYSVRPYDVSQSLDKIYPGKKHPYQRLIDKMREIMLEMGFTEIKGEIIQSSFWNFDALFQPQDHPAREMQDTFYLDTKAEIPDFTKVKEMHECGGGVGSTGWGGCWSPDIAKQEVLRTHTTSVTIKYLADHPEPPVKAFGIDRVYRREAIDATHTPEFEQLEGIIMDRGVTFSNLLGILKEFYAKMGFEEVRFRPGYFPYTEPSVEPEVFIDGLGWVELGGAGVFRKEVTAPFGIEHPVLAWGLGVSRVAMLKLGLKDLRLLYQSDIQWLRETPVSIKM